jgi:ADP-ribose pyrophosphatase
MTDVEYPGAPRVAVGAVVMRDGRVLVVERGKAPAEGVWALPGGSVELGETLGQAAEREVLEETGVVVRAGDVIYTFDAVVRDDDGRVRFHYVILDLACEYVQGEANAGGDARSARFVTPQEFRELRSSRATVDLLRRTTTFFGNDQAREQLDSQPGRK